MSTVFWTPDGWLPLLRIVVVGTLAYAALVLLLRASGSRTIASMRAFDFLVTVALGSVLGRALTARGVSLGEALTAFGLLVGLQYAVARLQVSSPRFARAVTNPPVLLWFRGRFLHDAMRRARVTEQELQAVVRKHGLGTFEGVDALVLEASGDVAVVLSAGDGSALGEQLRRQARQGD